MNDRQQILNHLLLWREPLLVEHKQFGMVLGTKTLEPREPKPHQPILVRDDEMRNLLGLDAIHQGDEFCSFEIETPTNFLDKLDVCQPSGNTELFQHSTLVL